jgi:ABC-type uncharacterized transport system ATPase component
MIGRVFQNPFSGTAATMSIAENFRAGDATGPFAGARLGTIGGS